MSENVKNKGLKKGRPIDIIQIVKIVLSKKKFVLKSMVLFFFLGTILALLSPIEYTAKSIFIPQLENSGKQGGLGSLASLAGISFSSLGGNSDIPPTLYPKIINSVRFRRSLLKVPITSNKSTEKISYEEYYEEIHNPGFLGTLKRYTIGLPSRVVELFGKKSQQDFSHSSKDNDLIFLTSKEVEHFKRLSGQIKVIPLEKEGTVELNFVMPEALMAAEMTKSAEKFLQQEVIEFKIQNAREQYEFAEEQYFLKEKEFHIKQKNLAEFRDHNQNISSALAKNKLQRLEADYNFAFSIYTEIAKQLEQAKVQVSKNTPVFSVINPVSVPIEKSAPSRALLVLGFTFLGFIVGVGVIFIRQYIKNIKSQW